MSMIKDEIHEFIVNNSILIEEVNDNICFKIRKNIDELYINKKERGVWLWEKLNCFDSICDKDGWKYIKEFVSEKSCVLLFNEFDEKAMFKLKNGNDLFCLLSETSGFEFYLTDINCSYLLCFNHHDILYGCGNAINWIGSLKTNLDKG